MEESDQIDVEDSLPDVPFSMHDRHNVHLTDENMALLILTLNFKHRLFMLAELYW